MSGIDSATTQPVIVAGDTQAIHARLADASAPHFCADALCFQSAGKSTTLKIPALLGQETLGHIYAPRTPEARVAYLQFLPDGDSLTTTSNGEVELGRWITDPRLSAIAERPQATSSSTARWDSLSLFDRACGRSGKGSGS